MSLDPAVTGKGIRRHIATAILVAAVFAMPAAAQRSAAQNQLSSPAADAERIRRLTASGVRVERGAVTAWFSSNAMTPEGC